MNMPFSLCCTSTLLKTSLARSEQALRHLMRKKKEFFDDKINGEKGVNQ